MWLMCAGGWSLPTASSPGTSPLAALGCHRIATNSVGHANGSYNEVGKFYEEDGVVLLRWTEIEPCVANRTIW